MKQEIIPLLAPLSVQKVNSIMGNVNKWIQLKEETMKYVPWKKNNSEMYFLVKDQYAICLGLIFAETMDLCCLKQGFEKC